MCSGVILLKLYCDPNLKISEIILSCYWSSYVNKYRLLLIGAQ